MVLARLAAVVENHGDASFSVIGFPLGQTFSVGVARLDEGEPDAADEAFELVGTVRRPVISRCRLTLWSMKGSSMPWDAPRALLSGFQVNR